MCARSEALGSCADLPCLGPLATSGASQVPASPGEGRRGFELGEPELGFGSGVGWSGEWTAARSWPAEVRYWP